jgi:signal transduction histidine kinase
MTDNFLRLTTGRSITLEARHVEALEESVDRLRLEVAELRASRERLVLAADADRRTLERDLHQGVQQQLVALAVNLQLAGELADGDPAAARTLLEEMQRHVQDALDDTARLAQRIYPPLLDAGGLRAALRAAAASAGTRASLDVDEGTGYPAEVAGTVYACCRAALEHAGANATTVVTVREERGSLSFEVVERGSRSTGSATAGPALVLDSLRDRVEALGGRLTIDSEPNGGTRLVGSLPLSR